MKKLLLLSCSLVLVFTACNKDDSVSMRTELITKGKWLQYANKVTTPSDTTDLFPLFPSCKQDDITEFRSDKTIQMDEGATKCGNDDPQSFSGGKWDFLMADTQLKIVDDTTIVYDISTLNDSLLILKNSVTVNNELVVNTIRFKKTN